MKKIFRSIKLMNAMYGDWTLTQESLPIPQLYMAERGGSSDEEICEVPYECIGEAISFISKENEYQMFMKPPTCPPVAPSWYPVGRETAL